MRAWLVVAWLFVGLGGAIYHFGPGQELAELDAIDQSLHTARQHVHAGDWESAVACYDHALSQIPVERVADSRRVILEKAKAQMLAKQLPAARESLGQLFVESLKDDSVDPRFLSEVESALANSQYYMTWLMRLEGLPKEEWLPEIEASRQHYWQVSERARELDDALAMSQSHEDLEAAVRLARMDLNELQSLPLPSQ
jgi:hypothetical protein